MTFGRIGVAMRWHCNPGFERLRPKPGFIGIVAAWRSHFQSCTQIAPRADSAGSEHVSVARVDLVTSRRFNLYFDLLELLGQADPSLAPEPPVVYAAAFRWPYEGDARHFWAWTRALMVGQPLPVLPLWLAEYLAVPLEPGATYEESCRILRIP
jgi:hypothetical protein